MEARASFSRSSVSKTFVAAILVIVAIGLAVMSAYVAKGLSGAPASQTHFAQPAPGSVLRQDNPVLVPGNALQQDRPGLSKHATDPADDVRIVRATHRL